MARKRVMNVGAINIKTHPHSDKKYIRLFEKILELDQIVKIHGSQWGILGSFRSHRMMGKNVYIGTIYKFLNIDPEAAWLDLKKKKPIEDDRDEEIPYIPDHLKPNAKGCQFLFMPSNHRLFFDASVITPKLMGGFFKRVAAIEDIFKKFGQVDIVVESSSDIIKKMLAVPKITKLEIDFTLPNGDSLASEQKKYVKRLERLNARRHKQSFIATSEKGLTPDDETVASMELAKSDGTVNMEGWDGDEKIKWSTSSHPLTKRHIYDPDIETRMEAMLYAATSMLPKGRTRI